MKYTLEMELNAPRIKVWELFSDAENLPCWQPGYQSMEHLSGSDGQSGARSKLVYENKGRIEMIETIIVNEAPREFTATFETEGRFAMQMENQNLFEELGPEKTKWISNNEANPSGWLLKIFAILMPGCFKKESWKYMENFKAFAEDGKDVREV